MGSGQACNWFALMGCWYWFAGSGDPISFYSIVGEVEVLGLNVVITVIFGYYLREVAIFEMFPDGISVNEF